MSEIVSTEDGGVAVPPSTLSSQQPVERVDWQAIEQDGQFRELVRAKRNFIVPATIFFIVYYFGFLILVGYAPSLVEVNVIGNINLAYLFAISEFIMAWVIVYLYVRRAGLFDRLASAILARVSRGEKS